MVERLSGGLVLVLVGLYGRPPVGWLAPQHLWAFPIEVSKENLLESVPRLPAQELPLQLSVYQVMPAAAQAVQSACH